MNACEDVEGLIAELADGVRALAVREPVLVGVLTGGLWVAERLRALLAVEAPLGALNINFYRDDFTRIGLHPQVHPSMLPFGVDDRHIVLVDDVLHTGRTVRAALNEVFDWGRPASVRLVVLIDRGGRELPIQPDVAGRRLALAPDEHIKLTGPAPLALEVQKIRPRAGYGARRRA